MNDQNYLSIGFNKFLTRIPASKTSLEDEDSVDLATIIGNQTYNGEGLSADGKLSIRWDENRIIVSDKARDRLVMGDLDRLGVYGIRVVDNTGATHFEESA